jgi:hypothetical protein
VVGHSGEKSNQIFAELASWEEVLEGSSLADPMPAAKAKREFKSGRRGLKWRTQRTTSAVTIAIPAAPLIAAAS